MDRPFFRHLLGTKPALWQAMLVFNGLCCSPMPEDPPALPGLTPEQTDQLRACPSLRGSVQHALLCAHKNTAHGSDAVSPFWDFTEEPRRLALLPGDIRLRLALVFGVATHAALLARVVVRADLMVLQKELSEEMLRYALQRGCFQVTQAPALTQGYSPPQALVRNIRAYGLRALHRIRAGWPPTLLARCPLPPEPFAPQENRDEAACAVLWSDMKKILLKEVAPAWTPCFD